MVELVRSRAFELERERALEDDVDLLLALVAVDAAALPGLQQHQVEAEALDAERVAEPHEALAGLEVERCKRGTGFHGRAGYARAMLDEADELYGLPLEEFTAARDALAKRLRGEKRREDADAVKALKRPSVAAGAINLAVREHGADELLAAGEELREAHGALLDGSGDAAAVREATARERDAVREFAQLALGDDASAATEEKVRATLHAASVDDEVREALVAGRLERDAEAGVDAMALMASKGAPKKAAKSGASGGASASGGRSSGGGEGRASGGEVLRRHEVAPAAASERRRRRRRLRAAASRTPRSGARRLPRGLRRRPRRRWRPRRRRTSAPTRRGRRWRRPRRRRGRPARWSRTSRARSARPAER